MLAFKLISPFFFMAMRIISVIVYLATIIAAFGGKVNPDYLTFPALLCLAFPFLAILSIVLIIFWALCRKIIFCAFGIFTIVICLTPMSDAFPLGSPRNAVGNEPVFKIISWNVIHTRDIRQPNFPGNRAVDYMINSGADIICLTELRYFSRRDMPNFSDALRDSLFSVYPFHAGLNSTDIKILSKYPVERLGKIGFNDTGSTSFDFFLVKFPQGRELVVAMAHLYSYGLSEEERQVVTEINSMQSAKSSMKEFKGSIRQKLRKAFRGRADDATKLREEIDDISPDVPLIVCGDFNDVPASWTYNIVRGDDMRDAYAETNFGPAITYNLHAFYFHIDQMLYRGPIMALDLTVGKINTSDHYPLIGEFQFLNPKP
ncbi:MAG: endonuclease/exonuclease/phosphatase family protein [Muribaculaceae bacterium]|nr:endonuclease/exonuclease/phosphatase family protein [Muribaculaceae bacterium]